MAAPASSVGSNVGVDVGGNVDVISLAPEASGVQRHHLFPHHRGAVVGVAVVWLGKG